MPEPTVPAIAPDSLPDLLRIMDVATALRRERELAAAHLDLDAVKATLRTKLRATADTMGDAVTDAEIEAAIERYFATQHEFREPPPGLQTALAHLYVRRRALGFVALGVAAFLFGMWALFVWPSGPLSPQARQARAEREMQRLQAERAAQAQAEAERRAAAAAAAAEREAKAQAAAAAALEAAWTAAQREHAALTATAQEADARTQADGLRREAEAAHGAGDLDVVKARAARLAELRADVEREYELRVVSRHGERSGIDAYYQDGNGKRVSGYYLIVEAVTPDGSVLTRAIRDAEDGRVRRVRKWGEQVPKAVYDRVADDKRADGVVDQNLFARKRRGFLQDEIVMPDATGATPLVRGRQITTKL